MTKIHNRCVTVTHLEYKSNSNHTGATPVALLINTLLRMECKNDVTKFNVVIRNINATGCNDCNFRLIVQNTNEYL